MKHKVCFVLLFAIITFDCNAQFLGSRNQSLANSSMGQNDLFSSLQNIASLTETKRAEFGFSGVRPFGIKGLNTSILLCRFPLVGHFFGAKYQQFSFRGMDYRSFQIAYALKLSDRISMGVKMHADQVQILELHAWTFYPSLGMQIKMNAKSNLGIVVNKLFINNRVFKWSGFYPDVRVGMSHELSESFSLFFEFQFTFRAALNFKAGLEYSIAKKVRLRCGFDLGQFHFGVGLRLGKIRLALASSYHTHLGMSPSFSLSNEEGLP